jgi:hypothetical protein
VHCSINEPRGANNPDRASTSGQHEEKHNCQIAEDVTREKTAESYFVRGRADRKLRDKLLLHQPALTKLDLFTASGQATPETVQAPLEKWTPFSHSRWSSPCNTVRLRRGGES